MRIVVDYDRCTGLGICESLAPELFEVDETGALVVLAESVSPDQLGCAQKAVEGCPTEALRLVS